MMACVPLLCPSHRKPLLLDENGAYRGECGCRFSTVNGVPRFVPLTTYADSFGLQWNTFRETQLDSYTKCPISRDRLARILGGSLDILRGQRVLEAGCGAGRFTELLLAAGAKVVAADLSCAVEANRKNCEGRPGYFVCQADIRNLPVPDGAFDIVICVGVIQHTPNSEETISRLCDYVKPGGALFIDHYSDDYPMPIGRKIFRLLFLTLPARWALKACSALISILWPIHRLIMKMLRPGIMRGQWLSRKLWGAFVRLSPVVDYQLVYPELGSELLRTWALLDTHDTLTDRYKHLRSTDEIRSCLEGCGMVNVVVSVGGNGIEASAHKPGGA